MAVFNTGDITWITKLGEKTVNVTNRIGTMYMAVKSTQRRIDEGHFIDTEVEDEDLSVEMWEGGQLAVTLIPILPEPEEKTAPGEGSEE